MASQAPRIPDYVIIGAMKSGTSSLYYWLASQPECAPAAQKEINFFSRDDLWARGPEWYSSFFAGADPGRLVGEASTSYTKNRSDVAAQRMAEVAPQAKLIYLLRHPVARLRSHYRHEVRRSRERRPLVEALRSPGNDYIRFSRYYERFESYLKLFPHEQLLVVRLEDLAADGAPGWNAVLKHLGLPPRALPTVVHNVTAAEPHFTPLFLKLWETDSYERILKAIPEPMRKLARSVLLREGPRYKARLEASEASIPEDLTAELWKDVGRLEEWLGAAQPLWTHSEPDAGAYPTISEAADKSE